MPTVSERHDGSQRDIERHFNEIAREYDYWKRKNWLYYETLQGIARKYASQHGRLLDVGCGTGDMIRAVAPETALGLDISEAMVEIARKRTVDEMHRFQVADIATYRTDERFDAVLFFDVIEHVVDMSAALCSLQSVLAPHGRLILSMANPLWEPILLLGEKLGMKMPEGPHYRMTHNELIEKAAAAGLELERQERHLLFPKYIPLFSAFMNKLGSFSPLQKLCVIQVYIFRAGNKD